MTVAFTGALSGTRTTTTNPHEILYTVSAGTRGLVLLLAHGGSDTDYVIGVTAGGVAMARVASIAQPSGAPGRVYIYFLGSGVPTGTNLTFSIGLTSATPEDISYYIAQYSGTTDIEVVDVETLAGLLTNPSVVLTHGGRSCASIGAIYSGLPAPTDLTVLTGMQSDAVRDHGTWSTRMDRRSTVASSDLTFGYTAAEADTALAAVAISERVAGAVAVAASTAAVSDAAGTLTVAAIVRDTFTRSTVDGWGSADSGGAWLVSSLTGDYDVSGTKGTVSVATADNTDRWAILPDSHVADDIIRATFRIDKVPEDGVLILRAIVRSDGADTYYALMLTISATSMVLGVSRGWTELDSIDLGLAPAAATDYHLKVQALGVSPTTLRAKVWSSAAAASASYGSGIGGDSLANTVSGNRETTDSIKQFIRFRAEQASPLTTVVVYWLGGLGDGIPDPGYSTGTDAPLQMSLHAVDADGFPTGPALATEACGFDNLTYADRVLTFTTPHTPTIGTLYALVFENTDPDPDTNYWSIDHWFYGNYDDAHLAINPFVSGYEAYGGRLNPRFADIDWATGLQSSSTGVWVHRAGFAPILDIEYDNGQHQGMSYGESSYGAGEIGEIITGTSKMVRERFTVASDITVSGADIRILRQSGTANLVVGLYTIGGTLIDSFSLTGASIVDGHAPGESDPGSGPSPDFWTDSGRDSLWYHGDFSAHRTLTTGEYYLRLSCAAGTTYWAFVNRRLSVSYSYSPVTAFHGVAEKTTDGSAWSSLGRVANQNDLSFQLVRVVGTPGAEPGSWQVSIADDDALYQRIEGVVGLTAYGSEALTNVPILVSWDDLDTLPADAGFSGTVFAVSGASAYLSLTARIEGSIAAASNMAVAPVSMRWALRGTVAAVATVTASLTMAEPAGTKALAGTVTATATISTPLLRATKPLAGSIAAASSASGGLSTGEEGTPVAMAALIPAVSTVVAAMIVTAQGVSVALEGAIEQQSRIAGSLSGTIGLSDSAGRGLLLRGVAGSRVAYRLPYDVGVAGSTWLLPYIIDQADVSVTWVLPYWMAGPGAATWILPYTIKGAISVTWTLPYSVHDGAVGIDEYGYVLSPRLGWTDDLPPPVIPYTALLDAVEGIAAHWRLSDRQQTIISDTFTREGPLGEAETGGPYATAGVVATDHSRLVFDLVPGSTAYAYLPTSALDQTTSFIFSLRAGLPSGGVLMWVVYLRATNTTDPGGYAFALSVTPAGGITYAVYERTPQVSIASGVIAGPGTVKPNRQWKAKVRVSGASPTTIRWKVWQEGASEPDWQGSVNSSHAMGQAANTYTGLAGWDQPGTGQSPAKLFVDDLTAAAPVGVVADDSLGGLDGTYEGNVAVTDGGVQADTDPAILLDGSAGSGVTVGDVLDITDNHPYSVVALVASTGGSGTARYIVSKMTATEGWALYQTTANGIAWGRMTPAGSDWAVTAPIAQGPWWHVAATFDGDYLRVYLEGVLAAVNANPLTERPMPDNAGILRIGRAPVSGPSWVGNLDEVAIFDRALDPGEIEALWSRSRGDGTIPMPPPSDYATVIESTPDLIAYWRLGETAVEVT